MKLRNRIVTPDGWVRWELPPLARGLLVIVVVGVGTIIWGLIHG